MSSVELFQKGGPVMYILLMCSLSVVAIAIDRYMFYKKAGNGTGELVKSLFLIISGKSAADIKTALAGRDNVVGFMALAAVDAVEKGSDIRLAVETAYGESAMQIRSKLNYLSMIVTMAPLLGLLGTIAGMIESFSIFNLQAGQPMAITGGIGEALIATATGLCVAILALIIHTAFAQWMDRLLTDMDSAEAAILAGFGIKDGGRENEA